MTEYGINTLGEGAQIFEPVTLGFPSWIIWVKPVLMEQ
jgi:hypothetical protein